MNDGLCQIKWLHIVDTPVAQWASTERQKFLVVYFGYSGENRLQLVINEALAAIIGKRECESLPAPSWKWASTECQRLLAFHHGESQRDVAIMVYIYHFDYVCMLQGSRILSGSSVNEMSWYCPARCGGNIPYVSADKGWHILVYGFLWLSATHIVEDARSKIVDTPLTLIFNMGLEAYCFLFLL